jgi:hypothetical protein
MQRVRQFGGPETDGPSRLRRDGRAARHHQDFAFGRRAVGMNVAIHNRWVGHVGSPHHLELAVKFVCGNRAWGKIWSAPDLLLTMIGLSLNNNTIQYSKYIFVWYFVQSSTAARGV